ncbi:unnamed protein product [Clavelina lepadiformis]|uniref:Uncharacterized protein n=1 Tax=Clavelina lepadiformis TaxID=159417 RepID=A0ABP0FRH7_CLALP
MLTRRSGTQIRSFVPDKHPYLSERLWAEPVRRNVKRFTNFHLFGFFCIVVAVAIVVVVAFTQSFERNVSARKRVETLSTSNEQTEKYFSNFPEKQKHRAKPLKLVLSRHKRDTNGTDVTTAMTAIDVNATTAASAEDVDTTPAVESNATTDVMDFTDTATTMDSNMTTTAMDVNTTAVTTTMAIDTTVTATAMSADTTTPDNSTADETTMTDINTTSITTVEQDTTSTASETTELANSTAGVEATTSSSQGDVTMTAAFQDNETTTSEMTTSTINQGTTNAAATTSLAAENTTADFNDTETTAMTTDDTTQPDATTEETTPATSTTDETTDDTTPTPTTAVDTTTTTTGAGGAVAAAGTDILLFVLAAILGILLLALIIVIILWCRKPNLWKKCCGRSPASYDVERVDAGTSFSSSPNNEETITLETWKMTMEREGTLKDAMLMGNISVLEFAIKQARSSGIFAVEESLIAQAETKLNVWKRTLSGLQDALQQKDLNSMEEFMSRYDEIGIKDETGTYRKSEELLREVSDVKDDLREAAIDGKEMTLSSAVEKFNNLALPANYATEIGEYATAKSMLDELRRDTLLKGRTEVELRKSLGDAIMRKDVPSIKTAMLQMTNAGIAKDDLDMVKGQRTLQEIEEKLSKNRDVASHKLLDASQERNAADLKDALRECSQYGVDEKEIRDGEKLLKLVEREDQLLRQMRELMVLRDSTKLLEAIAIFRTPGLQLVDKTGDVAKADELLQELREKERKQRAKSDAMWRLQNAINVGDVVVMEGMIRALESLASTGEDVDEAVLLRAKAELESIKGQVDYRTRMERIKSAIPRMAKAENIPQVADLIEQMAELSVMEDFKMTGDDSRVLDESRSVLHELKQKHAIKDEIDVVKPNLLLPLLSENLSPLKEGIESMKKLKTAAEEFEGVFNKEDEELLSKAQVSADDLSIKVNETTKARKRLDAAINARDFFQLNSALAQAEEAPFIDSSELENPKDLREFLNPTNRLADLTAALKSRNIPQLTLAIEDFKEAKVSGHAPLLEKAERRLKKLIKLEKKQKKLEKKQKREEARRKGDIEALDRGLENAINARDIEQLQEALMECENSGYEAGDIPLYSKAEELYDELVLDRLRETLLDAVDRRDILNLESAIDEADYGGYVEELGFDYLKAKDLLFHLRELKRLRESIAGMDRSLILEINRYPTPPSGVHTVMVAALVLLGDQRKNVTNWVDVQTAVGKLGKQSITRRVRRRAPGDITPEIREEVQKILGDLDIQAVQDSSKGAAAFFAWIKCMLTESMYANVNRPTGDEAGPSNDLKTTSF